MPRNPVLSRQGSSLGGRRGSDHTATYKGGDGEKKSFLRGMSRRRMSRNDFEEGASTASLTADSNTTDRHGDVNGLPCWENPLMDKPPEDELPAATGTTGDSASVPNPDPIGLNQLEWDKASSQTSPQIPNPSHNLRMLTRREERSLYPEREELEDMVVMCNDSFSSAIDSITVDISEADFFDFHNPSGQGRHTRVASSGGIGPNGGRCDERAAGGGSAAVGYGPGVGNRHDESFAAAGAVANCSLQQSPMRGSFRGAPSALSSSPPRHRSLSSSDAYSPRRHAPKPIVGRLHQMDEGGYRRRASSAVNQRDNSSREIGHKHRRSSSTAIVGDSPRADDALARKEEEMIKLAMQRSLEEPSRGHGGVAGNGPPVAGFAENSEMMGNSKVWKRGPNNKWIRVVPGLTQVREDLVYGEISQSQRSMMSQSQRSIKQDDQRLVNMERAMLEEAVNRSSHQSSFEYPAALEDSPPMTQGKEVDSDIALAMERSKQEVYNNRRSVAEASYNHGNGPRPFSNQPRTVEIDDEEYSTGELRVSCSDSSTSSADKLVWQRGPNKRWVRGPSQRNMISAGGHYIPSRFASEAESARLDRMEREKIALDAAVELSMRDAHSVSSDRSGSVRSGSIRGGSIRGGSMMSYE